MPSTFPLPTSLSLTLLMPGVATAEGLKPLKDETRIEYRQAPENNDCSQSVSSG